MESCEHEYKVIHCKVHKQFFCHQCILDHLKVMHRIDFHSDVDLAMKSMKEAIQKRVDQYKLAKELISEQRINLERKIAALKNNEALDAVYKEGVSRLRKEIEKAKHLKMPTIKYMEEMTKKLSRQEMAYERLFSFEQNGLKDIKEGKSEGLNKLYDERKDLVIDYKSLLVEAKKIGEEIMKYKEKDINTDKEIEAMTAMAIAMTKTAIKGTVAGFSSDYFSQVIKRKENQLNECKEEIASLREKINALKTIATGIEGYQKKTKDELLSVASVIEKNKKEMDAMLKKLVKCNICGALLCLYCNNDCKFCHQKQCKECLLICQNCTKDICKNCIKICLKCDDRCCPECIKDESHCNESYLRLDPACTKIYGISNALGGLSYFDLTKKKLVNTLLRVPSFCRIVQLQNRIFVTGGNCEKTVSEYIEATKTLVSKTSMTYGRYNHAIAQIAKTSFCVIGGHCGSCSYIKECEEYDINANDWKTFPSLTEGKYRIGVFLSKRSVLYCFGGYNGSAWQNTLERIELNPAPTSWAKVHLSTNEAAVGEIATFYQFSPNEILIFRGNNSSDAYIYDVQGNTIKKQTAIAPIGDYYYNCQYSYNGIIYTFGCNGHVHMFNPKEKEYTSMKFSTVK